MALHIHSFTFNSLQENTYIVYDNTKQCVIIDPGCADKQEQQELAQFIDLKQLTPKYLLNTHCHIDHILGNYFVKNHYKINLVIHANDHQTLRSVKLYAAMYGYPNYQETEPDIFITEGEKITFGDTSLDVLYVPGHAPGHIAFVHHESKNIFAGDVLFYRSIGRTDLPGGHHATLIDSIKNKLFSLSENYTVHPGHGPQTNVYDEKKLNPYLKNK